MLTRQQRAHRIATTELADIDRDLSMLVEDRARHRLCGPGCHRWVNDSASIDTLLGHRIKVSDWRDTEVMDERPSQDQSMAQAPRPGRH